MPQRIGEVIPEIMRLAMTDADAFIPDGTDDFKGAVRRTVIGDNHLVVLLYLSQDRAARKR